MSENLTATVKRSKLLSETEFERCECCSMTEEYTVAYIESVRNLYAGKFICGLCSEAVKYEIFRCGKKQRRISVDEALTIHMRICGEFVASLSPTTVDFISAIGEMFRRRILVSSTVVTSPTPGSITTVDGGAICATMVIGGGSGGCLHALTGGV